MERIKTELLMIAKQTGDSGSTSLIRKWTEKYLEALDIYLRPEGIKAFTAEQLRGPYVEYMKTVIETNDPEQAAQRVIQFFHTVPVLRNKPVELPLSSDCVVDIFSARP